MVKENIAALFQAVEIEENKQMAKDSINAKNKPLINNTFNKNVNTNRFPLMVTQDHKRRMNSIVHYPRNIMAHSIKRDIYNRAGFLRNSNIHNIPNRITHFSVVLNVIHFNFTLPLYGLVSPHALISESTVTLLSIVWPTDNLLSKVLKIETIPSITD
ncbi:hypothetical protein RF11_15373 [Thelohanellus kitauei]|uniref:Uncharacterized protein n=1 Tax=Thelohanellus kitauei TaxID=669202 RepID=A0A0C2MET7_THEKT|nr:hypothetical protein RF11_15373 [Thelohanellus kitauei]